MRKQISRSGGYLEKDSVVFKDRFGVPIKLNSVVRKGETLIMPSFLFAWICNEFNSQMILTTIDDFITVVSFCASFGALVKLSTSATKLYKTLTIANAVISTVDFAMVSNYINGKFKNQFKDPNTADKLIACWNLISVLNDTKSPVVALKY